MTRTISVLLAQSTAATLLLGCGFFAMAQDAIRDKVRVDVNAGQRDRDDRRDVIRLSTILKSKVLIQQNQPAGNVVDVVLSDGGCVEYIVASNRDQYYVVPYSAAQVRYADQVVFVDMAPAQFQNVAYFSANSWPNLYAPAYRNQVYAFYGLNVPRAGVNVNINGNLPINNRNRANNDSKADSATPETRKTLKPELPNTPKTPDLNKPKARGDLPVSPQPKEVIPPAADKKPVVPPSMKVIARSSGCWLLIREIPVFYPSEPGAGCPSGWFRVVGSTAPSTFESVCRQTAQGGNERVESARDHESL